MIGAGSAPSADEVVRLLEHSAEIVQQVDGANRTVWISPSVERLTGWAVAECLGETRWDLIHPEDAAAVADLLTELRSGGAAHRTAEVRLRHRRGSYLWWSLTARPLGEDPATCDVVLVLRNADVEVRQRREARRQQGLRLSTLQSMLDPVVLMTPVWDGGGRVVGFACAEANAAAGDYLGHDPADLLGRTLDDVLVPASADALMSLCAPVAETGVPVSLTDHPMPSSGRGGASRRFDLRAWPVEDLVGFTWRDVTDRFEAAAQVAAAKDRLSLLVETMAEGVIVFDPAGHIVEANPAARRIVGLPETGMLGKGVLGAGFRLVRPDGADVAAAEHPVAVALATGESVPATVLGMTRPDGTVTWIRTTVEPLPATSGGRAGVVATFSDVTASVTSDRLVRESQEWYRLLAESASEVVLQTGSDGRIAWASPSIEHVLGHVPDEVLGRPVTDLLHPADVGQLRQEMAANIATQRPGGERRLRVATADGRFRWMSALGRSLRDASGAVVGGIDALRDIHDEVLAQTRLAESEARLQLLLASLTEGVLVRDTAGVITACNPAAETILGLPRDRIIGATLTDTETCWVDEQGCRVPPQSHPALLALTTGNAVRGMVLGLQRADEAVTWLLVNAALLHGDVDPENVTGVVTTFTDITGRIAVDRQQRVADARYRTVVAASAAGLVVQAADGSVLDCNAAAEHMLGLTRDQLLGGTPVDPGWGTVREDGSDLPAGEHPATVALATGQPQSGVVVGIRSPDGAPTWLRVDVALFTRAEAPDEPAVVTSFIDITATLEAERALAASEARHRVLTESMRDVVWVMDAESMKVLYVSPSVEALRGFTPAEIEAEPVDAAMSSPAAAAMRAEMGARTRRARAGTLSPQEFFVDDLLQPCKDGSTVWTEVITSFHLDPGTDRLEVWGVTRDITERRAAAEALQASEERYRLLAETMSDLVEEYDPAWHLVWASPSSRAMLGLDADTVVGAHASDLIHPDDGVACDAVDAAVQEGREGLRQRMRRRRADGTYLWVDSSLSFRYDDGTHVATYVTSRDIDAQVAAERALRDSESRFRLLAENATDLVAHTDLAGTLRWLSPSTQRLLGWEPDAVVGRAAASLIHPEDLAALLDVQAGVSRGETVAARMRIRSADGAYRWFLASIRPVHDDGGRLAGLVAGFQDVEAETLARQELRDAHDRLELVLQASRLGLWDWNVQTGELVVNERWAEIAGYPLAEISPVTIDTWALLAHPDDLATSDALLAAHMAGETEFYDVDCRMRHRDGHWVWVRDRGRVVERDADGTPVRMTGTHEEITVLKEAAEALAASEQLFRVVMASAPVGMAVLDLDRRIVQANPALCSLLDRTEEWLRDRSVAEVLDAPDDHLDNRMRRHLATMPGQSVTFEHRLLRSDGVHIWVQQSINTLVDTRGAVSGYVSQYVDITEAREARRRLRDLAARDPLTNLLNRRELNDRIAGLLESRQRDGSELAVLFIDLDDLKKVNDTYGHLAGDEVIREVAQRVRGVVRHDDLVARYGGDEFVVVLPRIQRGSDAERIAAHVRATTHAPVEAYGHRIAITYSIGVATTEHVADAEALLALADAGVYRAKRDGKDRIVVCDGAGTWSEGRDDGRVVARPTPEAAPLLLMAPIAATL